MTFWIQDTTAGGGFTEVADIGTNWNGPVCGPDGFSDVPFTYAAPIAGHVYEVRVVDWTAPGCSDRPDVCVKGAVTVVGDPNAAIVDTIASEADFSLSLDRSSGSIPAARSVTVGVSLAMRGVFDAPITLQVASLPAGVSASYFPPTVSPTNPTSTLTLTAAPGLLSGVYALTVRTDSSLTGAGKTATYTLTVIPNDFSLALSLGSGSVQPGGSVATEVNLTSAHGYVETATLDIKGLPTGVTASFSPTTIRLQEPTSILTLTASETAPMGLYTLTVGTDSTLPGTDKTATYQLFVNGDPAF